MGCVTEMKRLRLEWGSLSGILVGLVECLGSSMVNLVLTLGSFLQFRTSYILNTKLLKICAVCE